MKKIILVLTLLTNAQLSFAESEAARHISDCLTATPNSSIKAHDKAVFACYKDLVIENAAQCFKIASAVVDEAAQYYLNNICTNRFGVTLEQSTKAEYARKISECLLEASNDKAVLTCYKELVINNADQCFKIADALVDERLESNLYSLCRSRFKGQIESGIFNF